MRKVLEPKASTLAQKQFDLAGFAESIDAAYLASGREPSTRAKKSFAPSGVGYGAGTCARRWYYDFTGGLVREDNNDAMGIASMDYGTEAHARLQKVLDKTGNLIEAERKVISEDPPIFGYADVVMKWQGQEVVGEIKTTTQESFVSKDSKNAGAGYHLLQVLIYMKVLEMNKGFLLYENKNNQKLLVVPVVWNDFNKELIERTFEWMRKVRANWESGLMPNRPYTQKSIACKSCPFSTHCWNDDTEPQVTIERLNVPK